MTSLKVLDSLEGLKKIESPLEALSKVNNSLSNTENVDKILIIILDLSGSMSGELSSGVSKIDALWNSVQKNLAPKLSGLSYGIIGFGIIGQSRQDSVAWVISPTNDPKRILEHKKPVALGSTPMLMGLKMAWNYATDHVNKSRFILISDGIPTDAGTCEILGNCERNNKIPIDTIGIGELGSYGYDEHFLREISRLTGGIFSPVNSIYDISDTITMLAPSNRLLLGTIK
jgi:hypothetical protein